MSSALAQPEIEGGFDRFQLDSRLTDALRAAGFHRPRPIQSETIPACLAGRDVMGLAQTGTGKTAAFALPILHRLLGTRRKGTRALVLAPTRELARQIDEEFRSLARFGDTSSVTIFGGVAQRAQVKALRRRPDLVVGCPGRVLDLLQQGLLDLRGVETLVLDEADHMFDMGFFRDVRKILERLPKRRQNLLFSATMPREVRALASQVLRDPCVVELSRSAPSECIEHFLVPVREEQKRALLEYVLAREDCRSAIVFMRTKHRAKRAAEQLARQGRSAIALQGNMSQPQRDRAMAGFRAGRYDVLVATDIAARGLDVAGVDYVVNFDVPNTAEAYTHRIGRTGRSGESGKACTFVTTADRAWQRDTERTLGSAIPVRPVPEGLGFDRPRLALSRSTRDDTSRARSRPDAQRRRPRSRRPARQAR